MDFPKILKDIEARRFQPLYVFDGEETYYMDILTNRIVDLALDDHERDFNQSIIYAQDVKPEEVVNIAKRYPMMAERQVVVVKEAQAWKKIDGLMPLFEQPVPTTVFVLNYRGKKVDGRSALAKTLKKVAVYHTGAKIRDWEVEKWIMSYAVEHNIAIDQDAIRLLAEHVGADLIQLVKSFDRFKLFLKPQERVTMDLVSNLIGVSKDFNVFELQKALATGRSAKALQIADYFARDSKDNHVTMVVASLFRFFSKVLAYHTLSPGMNDKEAALALGVNPFFVKDYAQAARLYNLPRSIRVMDVLYDIELKAKGVNASNADSGDLVRELTARLLYE